MPARPWTRLGIVAMAGHLAYELAAGVALPLASRAGIGPAALGYAGAAATGYHLAGRSPGARGDRVFAVANGFFLAAAVAHFTSWPRVSRAGLPWLTECEGMERRLMPPYNLLLYTAAVAGTAGLRENRNALRWGLGTLAVAAPALRRSTAPEYARLLQQAADHPRWWNRRLQRRALGPPG